MKKGSKVCVNMTGLKSWENYAYCFLDGTVKQSTCFRVVVELDQELGQVTCSSDRLQKQRGATKGHVWSKGDEVQVREQNGDVIGWWSAVIVSSPKARDETCTVKWVGDYANHGRKSIVRLENMRLENSGGALGWTCDQCTFRDNHRFYDLCCKMCFEPQPRERNQKYDDPFSLPPSPPTKKQKHKDDDKIDYLIKECCDSIRTVLLKNMNLL